MKMDMLEKGKGDYIILISRNLGLEQGGGGGGLQPAFYATIHYCVTYHVMCTKVYSYIALCITHL